MVSQHRSWTKFNHAKDGRGRGRGRGRDGMKRESQPVARKGCNGDMENSFNSHLISEDIVLSCTGESGD
jgi:hypothetical protein